MPARSPSTPGQLEAAWPPLLTIARAVAYSGCSRSTLGRAIKRGDLPLYGRAGGPRGQRVVRRVDLDEWLRGDPVAGDGADGVPGIATRSKHEPAAVDRALARIAAAARGKK